MRAILAVTAATLILGCTETVHGENFRQNCEQASHALRVHDSRIEAAKLSGAYGFTAMFASRGNTTYHCATVSGDQVACSTVMPNLRTTETARLNRLMRERSVIEARAARACQT